VHPPILYHIIPLKEPKGLSLNTAAKSDRIEVGKGAKVEKAEVIKLQFSGQFTLRLGVEGQGKHSLANIE